MLSETDSETVERPQFASSQVMFDLNMDFSANYHLAIRSFHSLPKLRAYLNYKQQSRGQI